MLFKGRQKGWEDQEEDVSTYWMTLRETEDTGIRKRKHEIALRGQLTSEQAMDLSQDRLHNEYMNEPMIKWMQLNILIIHTQKIITLQHLMCKPPSEVIHFCKVTIYKMYLEMSI
jgi:hypothetical protein